MTTETVKLEAKQRLEAIEREAFILYVMDELEGIEQQRAIVEKETSYYNKLANRTEEDYKDSFYGHDIAFGGKRKQEYINRVKNKS